MSSRPEGTVEAGFDDSTYSTQFITQIHHELTFGSIIEALMYVNRNHAIIGPRTVLVPYRNEHVARYHEWMCDQELRESTASEPLSLEEEYEMCQRWAMDEDKLTFIILERHTSLPIGDTDLATFQRSHQSLDQMIGDVNLFLSPDDSLNSTGESSENGAQKAELEIMIASKKHRRLGLATEVLKLFISYIHILISAQPLPFIKPTFSMPVINFFFVKISIHNTVSQKLFMNLGFEKFSTNWVFEEHELRLNPNQATCIIDRQLGPALSQNFSLQDTADVPSPFTARWARFLIHTWQNI
ncbi:hypothetical protein O181_047522 [Austropuccinia psidii MF-1]|uniref:N-acetyltransferase domain-containing protein n=1 Tax=Austropuccinia psidii MF-1 TaxID=1389203 RepID=A0A9Q3HKQ6_9BASI|nr:hypothetical protein [Austropuccinia psidii MF-1]